MTTPVPTRQAASLRTKLGWAAAILIGLPVLWTAVFWQEITVYREFKRLCATDAGLKVFEKLEPGQVWEVEQFIPAKWWVARKEVGLARTTADDGKLVDVKALSYGVTPSTEILAADMTRPARYRLTDKREDLVTNPILEVRSIEVLDLQLRRTVIVERAYVFMSSPRLFDSLSPFDHPWVKDRCPQVSASRFIEETSAFFK